MTSLTQRPELSAAPVFLDLVPALFLLGWDGTVDPFQPVTAERPEVQALIRCPEPDA